MDGSSEGARGVCSLWPSGPTMSGAGPHEGSSELLLTSLFTHPTLVRSSPTSSRNPYLMSPMDTDSASPSHLLLISNLLSIDSGGGKHTGLRGQTRWALASRGAHAATQLQYPSVGMWALQWQGC